MERRYALHTRRFFVRPYAYRIRAGLQTLPGASPQTPPKGAALWNPAGAPPRPPPKGLSPFGIPQR
jgi:hypothetical protein